ncbi:MAG TPA: glycosyltransferase family 9 protein [Terriglobales bacterium]|jgi:heptosyltransferase-1|nr:glycosyltransferase family 9 protein [Terriglobales bacterium]
MDRILIVRLGAMGDVVHALPAVAALRATFPNVRIGWAVEERWSELLVAAGADSAPRGSPQKPLVDIVHRVDTKAWRAALLSDETWKEVANALGEVRAGSYQLAIDFQGLLKSAALAYWSGATVAGFDNPKERPAGMLYSRRIPVIATHVVEQNLQLVRAAAGIDKTQPRSPLPHDPAAETWCESELERRNISRFVLTSPGAGWGAKLWPAQRYGELSQALALQGLPAILNVGPGEDQLARAVEQASHGTAQPIRCSMGELVALTRRARLFIGGDSGPMHLAAALGIPVVAIFGPTDPARNGPYGTPSIVLRSPASRTSYAHTSRQEEGMLAISVDDVLEAARRLLETSI